jgi:hypothetical protein
MENHLWTQHQGHHYIGPLHNKAWRIVEAQHILSTRKLVDTAHEQEILEELIDAVKPAFSSPLFAGLHPLLFTPFRYPPLPYGSRFGKRSEPSLWYGSLTLSGAMAEKAFYQYSFLKASKANFGIIEVTLTAFSTHIKTKKGVNLSLFPFEKFSHFISSPTDYSTSQALGTAMRNANVEAFLYISARDPDKCLNIGIFSPRAFLYRYPDGDSFQTWQCVANSDTVEFRRTSTLNKEYLCFTADLFMVQGMLPAIP